MLTVGGLFSGIGGLELGLSRAGMEISWMCDIDSFCQEVLRKNFAGVEIYGNVKSVDWGNAKHVDVVCGGFPCQPHSVAGKRKAGRDERDLWPEFARCIRQVKPSWVVAENVPGLLSSESGRFFGKVLRDLAALGYDARWFSIRASDIGAPHRRERIFVVAHAGHRGRWSNVQSERKPQCCVETNTWRYGEVQSFPYSSFFGCQPAGASWRGRAGLADGGSLAYGDGCGFAAQEQNVHAGQSDINRGGQLANTECGSGAFFRPSGGIRRREEFEENCPAESWPSPPGQPQYSWEEKRSIELPLGGSVDGIPVRLVRFANRNALCAYGNAVVPQVAEMVGRMIVGAI
ncbi:MAG: DNA cytosine methyltransferase [Candidatus Thermoplasmatota archaeon]|nr:DNA cytosine methyltransferase [Candidatus Thermoplasmatota archaeon]